MHIVDGTGRNSRGVLSEMRGNASGGSVRGSDLRYRQDDFNRLGGTGRNHDRVAVHINDYLNGRRSSGVRCLRIAGVFRDNGHAGGGRGDIGSSIDFNGSANRISRRSARDGGGSHEGIDSHIRVLISRNGELQYRLVAHGQEGVRQSLQGNGRDSLSNDEVISIDIAAMVQDIHFSGGMERGSGAVDASGNAIVVATIAGSNQHLFVTNLDNVADN